MRPLIWALKEVDPLGLRRQSGIHAQEIQEQLQFYAILGVTCTLRLQRRKIDTHHVTTCNIVKLRIHQNNYKYIEFIDYNLMFIQKSKLILYIEIIYIRTCTLSLSENIQIICTSFRNKQKSERLASFSVFSQRVQTDFIFSDNGRILYVPCNVKYPKNN